MTFFKTAHRIAQARGDAFTWLVSLEARAGALASMHSFITSCPELLTEDIVRRLAVPIEAALNLLTLLSGMTHPPSLLIYVFLCLPVVFFL
jgi:hypothetical protein